MGKNKVVSKKDDGVKKKCLSGRLAKIREAQEKGRRSREFERDHRPRRIAINTR